MIKVGIIGSTGYAGAELVRLLSGHKDVSIVWYGSKSYIDKRFSHVYRNFFNIIEDKCLDDNIDELANLADVIFTATPQGFCASLMKESILSKTKIIDLSADFRIKKVEKYEEWYSIKHNSPEFLCESVYGLCEINRQQIKDARLLANPGCYPTCSTLAIYPLLKEGLIDSNSIIIDAKSGTSGAGRGAKVDNLYCEVNENIKAYGVTSHRHTPEIEDQLSLAADKEIMINFTPHLVPMNRGILVTAYANLVEKLSEHQVREIYQKYYQEEAFIRLLEQEMCPETRWVEGSNYVDINFKIDQRTNRVIMMSALDNLIKGAAGQAVQNMNIMFGIQEETGLLQVPMFP